MASIVLLISGGVCFDRYLKARLISVPTSFNGSCHSIFFVSPLQRTAIIEVTYQTFNKFQYLTTDYDQHFNGPSASIGLICCDMIVVHKKSKKNAQFFAAADQVSQLFSSFVSMVSTIFDFVFRLLSKRAHFGDGIELKLSNVCR